MRAVLKLARLLALGFSLSLRRSAAFRVNLMFDGMLSVLALLSALATISMIFSRTETLAGWTRSDMLVLIGTFELLTGLKLTVLDPNLESFASRGIREGHLDQHLLQPAPTLFLVSLSNSAPLAVVQMFLGLGVIVLGITSHARPPGPGAILAWAVLVGLAVIVMWAVGMLLTCLAFWAPKLDLQSLYRSAWQFGRYPTEIFARPVRLILTYVIPMALVATVPARVLIHPVQPRFIVEAALTTVVVVALAVGAWRRGLKSYTGATS